MIQLKVFFKRHLRGFQQAGKRNHQSPQGILSIFIFDLERWRKTKTVKRDKSQDHPYLQTKPTTIVVAKHWHPPTPSHI